MQPIDSSAPAISGSGFLPNAVYPTTPAPRLETNAARFGSYLGADTFTGEVHSRWYRPGAECGLLVSGYPDGKLKVLALEGQNNRGEIQRRIVTPAEAPGETWVPVIMNIPDSWVRFRIVAEDHAPGYQGWLGFSEPFIAYRSVATLAVHLLLLFLSAIASFLLILGPGLMLRILSRGRGSAMPAFYWLPVPGLIAAVAIGLLAWKGPKFLPPPAAAAAGLGVVAACCLICFAISRPSLILNRAEVRVVCIVVTLVLIASAKATYTIGPAGELYGGTISRSLEVGDRSDSRINYHLVQMIASRERAFGPIATRWLAPWNFSHRGPVAGLATSAIVLATPGRPTTDMPDAPWDVFDRGGFAAYRVAFIVISSCMLLPVYGLLRLFLEEKPAFLGFLVVVGSPFVIHEIYFTWPKIIAAGLVMIAACLAWKRQYLASGLMLGFAYLSHPSALFSTPPLLSLPLLQCGTIQNVLSQVRTLIWAWFRQLLSLSGCLTFWRIINGKHFSQDGFMVYLRMADRLPPTAANWLSVRWLSLLNTIVPLHLFFGNADNWAIVLSGVAPRTVTFFFQDWTSLPSGIGLLVFVSWLYWTALGFRFAPYALFLLVVLPFFIFLVYWGSATTGLLREGLHSWLLGALCFGVWCWLRDGALSPGWWKFTSFALLLRGAETIGMLIVPGIAATGRFVSKDFFLSDLLALPVILLACSALSIYTFRTSESLRRAVVEG